MISSCTHAVSCSCFCCCFWLWPGCCTALYSVVLCCCCCLLFVARLYVALFRGQNDCNSAWHARTRRMVISLKWPFVVCKCCLLLTLLYRVSLNKYLCRLSRYAYLLLLPLTTGCSFMGRGVTQDTTFALRASRGGSSCCCFLLLLVLLNKD